MTALRFKTWLRAHASGCVAWSLPPSAGWCFWRFASPAGGGSFIPERLFATMLARQKHLWKRIAMAEVCLSPARAYARLMALATLLDPERAVRAREAIAVLTAPERAESEAA